MECLNTIIGLSQSECSCLPDKGALDAIKSDSGIYLDTGLSLKGLNQADCDEPNNIWQILSNSRARAIKDTLIDLNVAINSKYNKSKGYDGYLGKEKTTANVPTPELYKAFRIKCRNFHGAFITIRDIQVKFTDTDTSNLLIYNNISDQPLYTIQVTSDAGLWASNTVDIKLPLWSEEETELEYYFLHQKEGFTNESNCFGCQSSSVQKYLSLDGIRVNDLQLETFESAKSKTNLHGVRLNAKIECDVDLCNLSVENRDGLATAIAMRGKVILIDEINKIGKINAYTLILSEALANDIQRYNELYNEWIQYLAQNLPKNGCFSCDRGIQRRPNLL